MSDVTRIRDLENELSQTKADLSAVKTELAITQTQLTQVTKNQDKYQSGVNRGLWVIGGGFISAIVAWIVQGGLSS